jgi:predicted regulator of Ras-like GTPase activity (Roadblock/LC7/MglB family)
MEPENMDNDVYSFALKSTLGEIRNVCPGIKNSFMFKQDGEIIARDENTPEKIVVRVVDTFDGVLEKTDAIGGVERMTLECSKGRVNVSGIDNLYLVTVTSKKADVNYVNIVARVLIPTVLKLLEKIHPAPLKSNLPTSEIESEVPVVKEAEKPAEVSAEEPITEELQEPLEPELLLPVPPVNQLIVEDLRGLRVPSDTVRIDSETLSEWEGKYDGRKIEEVEVETFDGKLTQCKVKPIKDWKYEGKGIIRVPEKIQLTLETKKGELVRVKPIVE